MMPGISAKKRFLPKRMASGRISTLQGKLLF